MLSRPMRFSVPEVACHATKQPTNQENAIGAGYKVGILFYFIVGGGGII